MWYSIIRGDFSKEKNILHNLFSTFEILILILHSLVEKFLKAKDCIWYYYKSFY